jgi:hypothetical protein
MASDRLPRRPGIVREIELVPRPGRPRLARGTRRSPLQRRNGNGSWQQRYNLAAAKTQDIMAYHRTPSSDSGFRGA